MLEKGQTIKNYKELYEIMDCEAKAGDSKMTYLKELETLCKYHKDGHKLWKEFIKLVYNKLNGGGIMYCYNAYETMYNKYVLAGEVISDKNYNSSIKKYKR